ncbi:MAG: SpoIIIAH-like family protein [Clostridia bacterium]|nr:SpoIIIAH-like family protein [Clostridia bacterium]
MSIKKNHVIITALVVMIAAAGYLNYIDSTPGDVSEVMLTDEGELAAVPDDVAVNDEDTLILGEEAAVESTTQKTEKSGKADKKESGEGESEEAADPNAGTAVFVNSSNDSSYFVQAKLDREQSRNKQKDMLNEMLNNENIDDEKKNEVTTAMLEIQQRIEKETAAESMIEAKGFSEVYVRIDEDTVDVVVDKAELTDAEIAQIEDIVKRKTGVSADKIRITPLKK